MLVVLAHSYEVETMVVQWTLALTNSEGTNKFCSIQQGFVESKLLKMVGK